MNYDEWKQGMNKERAKKAMQHSNLDTLTEWWIEEQIEALADRDATIAEMREAHQEMRKIIETLSKTGSDGLYYIRQEARAILAKYPQKGK